jgi:prepilin-type N-terminal cleavage/methylation domain-containing protein
MRKRRPGYTLLEVLLAMAIAVMLLAAVYSVIGYQLRQAQAGRDLIEQATLARAILNKIDADVRATLTLGDPARFRRQPESQSGGSGGGSGGGMGTSGTGASTTPMTGTGAAGANASGANTAGTPAADTSGAAGAATTTTPVTIPLGVIGGTNDLHLFGSKFPNEVYDGSQVTCDQRRISYWLGDSDAGLCRLEQKLVTSEDGASTSLPGDVENYVLAAEVKSFEVSYFDGSSWLGSWDSTELGPDEKTPKGSPRAIKIRVGLTQPNRKDGELKYHTHVILIPTAGAAPPATTPDTAEAAATTTSPP